MVVPVYLELVLIAENSKCRNGFYFADTGRLFQIHRFLHDFILESMVDNTTTLQLPKIPAYFRGEPRHLFHCVAAVHGNGVAPESSGYVEGHPLDLGKGRLDIAFGKASLR